MAVGTPFVKTWDGPPGRRIVCLHALGGTSTHWDEVGPKLGRIGRVEALDLIGFGRTRMGSAGAGLAANQRLVATIVDGRDPVYIVGSSFGGAVALLQAVSDPASVRGLILTGSMLPEPGLDPRWVRRHLIARRLRQRVGDVGRVARAMRYGRLRPTGASVRAFLLRENAARPESMSEAIVSANVRAMGSRGRQLLRATFDGGTSSFGLLTDPARFRAIVDAVRCPVLVVHGACDRSVPVANAIALARYRPTWELVVLQNVGHLPHLEAPDAWLSIVTDWLTARG